MAKKGYQNVDQIIGSQLVEGLDYRNVYVIGTHAYIPDTGWCLITKVDKTDLLSFRYNLIIIFFSIFLLAGIIFSTISRLISRKITKPIEVLQSGIEKIKGGDLDYKVEVKTKDELAELSNAFNTLTSAVKQSRLNVDIKVKEQTSEITEKAKELEDQKIAIMNVLEDVQVEKSKADELASIVRDANEPIVSQTLDGTILSWNNGAENLYGYSTEEIVGESIKMIIPEDKLEEYENINKTVAEAPLVLIEHYQTVRKKKDGSLVDVAISVSPIMDLSKKVIGVSVITLDITKEKEIDKAKTEFVSLASHQLRTPLSAINWYTEMLLAEDAGPINEEQKKYLNEVAVGNKRMVDLVDSLLNVSRLDLGTFIIEPEKVNVLEMSRSVINELKPQADGKNIKIEESYGDNVGEFSADRKLLRIIIQNLLSNAVKYTPKDGKVGISIKYLKERESLSDKTMKGDSLTFVVNDSGIGIPINQQDKMFSKLFRADNARESETEGTGLGLYIIKSIVDQSGGEIWFKSEEGKGSTFYVTFSESGMEKRNGLKKLD